jgi:Calcium-dependent channel, 7TM region, putative phosphate
VLNNYLAVALLLVLLSLLPIVFDLIARSYEGLKLESEIQNSIMTRYFYYQLANVFVSVGLGSIASSLHQIIENPSSILSILGTSLPSLSIYFTNLLIVKTFTAVPLELLRVWPLLQILSVRLCLDRNKCTIRELKTGNTSSACLLLSAACHSVLEIGSAEHLTILNVLASCVQLGCFGVDGTVAQLCFNNIKNTTLTGAFANPPISYGWIYPNLLMVLMIISTYCCVSAFKKLSIF